MVALSPVFVPEIDEAPAPNVRADVFATFPINETVPVLTVSAVVRVALVTDEASVARSIVILFGTSASEILAQVRFPFAAIVVANWLAPQSVGLAARAVAVPAFPEIVVWSPVFVPVDVPEPDGAPTIAAVIPETVPVNVGEASGANAVDVNAFVPSVPPVPMFNVEPSVPASVKILFTVKLFPDAKVRPVTVAALPVVFWFNVGKSPATAILGTPVTVVFLRIPVASDESNVLLIPTTVSAVAPVASPVCVAFETNEEYKVLTALSPVFVPETDALSDTVSVLPAAMFNVFVPFAVTVSPLNVLFVRASEPASVAKSAPVSAVLKSEILPVIPTILVWSPVFVPVDVPEPDGAPTIAAVIPETVPVNVGDASGAKAVDVNAFVPSKPVTEFRLVSEAVRPAKADADSAKSTTPFVFVS